MELQKIKLHRNQEKGMAVSQITLDDDYNVPDYRPDLMKVIKEKGEIRFDEIKGGNGAVWIKGSLIFGVLYRSDRENGKISCLRGEIPFQEKLNMDGLSEYETVKAEGEIEDLTIGVINSRKLSVRAVVILKAYAKEEMDEELSCGVENGENYEQKLEKKEVLRLMFSKKDICRQKNEIVLPSSKPNVREILWKSMELRNTEGRIKDGKVEVTGEVLVSALYSDEEEGERLQWYETTVPLDSNVDLEFREDEIISRVNINPVSVELEVKPDYDGEERILVLELALELDITAWKEEKIDLLEDVYSLKKNVLLERKRRNLEKLLIKNSAKCRITEQMELPEGQERILQICACEGKVLLEKKELTAEGVLAEGIIMVELLYITTDDHMPLGMIKEMYPFSQIVEMPEHKDNVKVELSSGLEQLSAVMLDQEHIEVKTVIHLDLLALEQVEVDNIEQISEEPFDLEELKSSPGMIGYITKEGDNLWKIARDNHTTIREIMETNGLKEEKIHVGDKLLIIKNITLLKKDML